MSNIHIKTILRHLYRNKLFTGLNIIGLTIGITACWIILSIVRYEMSYESDIPKKDNIYRLVTGRVFDEKETIYGGISAPMYQGIREEIAEVKAAIPVFDQWIDVVKIVESNISIDEPDNIIATDSSYFDLVPYHWLVGNVKTAFLHPESVVLTRSRAEIYFPNTNLEDIVGRTVHYNDTVPKVISAIVADLTFPTDFSAKEIIYLKPKVYPLSEWTNTNGSDKLYIVPHSHADIEKIDAKIEHLASSKWEEFKIGKDISFELNRWFELIPLDRMHFATHIDEHGVRKVNIKLIYGITGIGLFLLMLACINYINLSTAQIPQRGKDIGVRKTLGSSNRYLIFQMLSETLLIVIVSVILSAVLTPFGFHVLNDIAPEGANLFIFDFDTLSILVGVLLLTVLLSGLYPALQITKVNPVESIKNGLTKNVGKSQLNLRKGLIVFQYTIAQCFIIGAIVIGQQLKYMVQKDLGFDKENVIITEIPWKIAIDDRYEGRNILFTNEIKKIDGINDAILADVPMREGYSSSPYVYTSDQTSEPISRQLIRKVVDKSYLDFYDIKLIAGANFQSTEAAFIINESAASAYGFVSPTDAIGKLLKNGDQFFPIVGVVKDFHVNDFFNAIGPVAIVNNTADPETSKIRSVQIKLGENSAQWEKTITNIKDTWSKFYPSDYFDYKFYDQRIEALYKREQNFAQLVNLAMFISVIIGCLGLFGLATITAYQRTKEIGIRKVLGASVAGITGMLSKDFVKLVCLAIVIASPLTWWAMNKWLDDFVYKIEIGWSVFALAGILAIVIALFTISFQSIKAALANPVDSLRDE